MNLEILVMYCIVSFFYVISPGPAVFLAIYNGVSNGVHTVVASAFGNILGLLLLSTVSISGLSAFLLASATLFSAFKIIGACYLLYLGIRQLVASFQSRDETMVVEDKALRGGFSYFREGFFVAVTNPKPILFFTALFPQFLDIHQSLAPQFFTMTLIFMMFSFISLVSYGVIASRAKRLVAAPSKTRWFKRISGSLFVGLGASLYYIKEPS